MSPTKNNVLNYSSTSMKLYRASLQPSPHGPLNGTVHFTHAGKYLAVSVAFIGVFADGKTPIVHPAVVSQAANGGWITVFVALQVKVFAAVVC